MDVTYMLRLKPEEPRSAEELTASNCNRLALLRKRVEHLSMEIMRTDAIYGVIILKGTKAAVEKLYGIKLTYAPRQEALGTDFPESSTMIDKSWRIKGTPVVPPELSDFVAEVIIY